MNLKQAFLLIVSLIILIVPSFAVDYKVDTTFNAGFFSHSVFDVHILSDGKLLVAGADCSSGPTCVPMLRRLNTDGSTDPSFTSPLSLPLQEGGYVRSIRPLPNGQFLITGRFNIGAQLSNFVKINSDGSVDASMPPAFLDDPDIVPTHDGKYIVCGERTFSGQNYAVAYRLNSDGTHDPSFRVTFIVGNCRRAIPLPNGKTLIHVGTFTFQTPIKPLYRLNNDGTQDTSFNADFPVGAGIGGLTQLQDGKLLLSYQNPNGTGGSSKRLLPDGAVEMTTPLCTGNFFLPEPDGSVLTNECTRWAGYSTRFLRFARMYADGSVDSEMDYIRFDNYFEVEGFRNAGSGKYYAFGQFHAVSHLPQTAKLVRLEPNTTPRKASFDFDGDGRSDLAVFRPSDRTWYINRSSAGLAYKIWGLSTDKLAATHIENDGKTDIAIYRDGVFHATSSSLGGHYQVGFFSSAPGDQPMFGNFEDDGQDLEDYAVRGLRSGVMTWFVRTGNNAVPGSWSPATSILPNEQQSDKPVAGDFNGDSRDEIGYFRDGLWYTADYQFQQQPQTIQWGIAGDIPVPGDYDGDRQTDYAIFRPSTGDWWINRSTDGIFVMHWGTNGDIPVPADYDGDGKVDVAIYRNGAWWQYLMGTGAVQVANWGLAGDIPIPAQSQF